MNIAPQQIQTNQPDVPCAECGRIFASSDVILLKNLWICGDCKPLVLQRLSEGVPVTAFAGMWRVKNELMTRQDTPFPDRCVRCNAPAHGYRQKVVFIAFFIWKKVELHIGLCERHRARRKRGLIGAAFSALGGMFLLIGGIAAGMTYPASLGAIIIVISGLSCSGSLRAGLTASRFNLSTVWLKRVHKDFLAELPEWDE